MKKVLLLAVMAVVLMSLNAQESILPIDSVTKEITFSEVIPVENVQSNELYSRAKQWISTAYVSSKDVIQMDDKEQGTLIVKAMTNVYTTFMVRVGIGVVKYTLTIAVKDGRYKYSITNLWHNADYNVDPRSNVNTPGDLRVEKPGGGMMSMGMKNWNGIKTQTKNSIDELIISMKDAMSKPSKKAEIW